MLIWCHVCNFVDDIHRHFCCRCRIQYDGNIFFVTKLCDIMNCLKRNLMLKNYHVIFHQFIFDSIHISLVNFPICSRNNNNCIVTLTNCNHRNSCRHAFQNLDMLCLYANTIQIIQHSASIVIITNAAEHLDFSTKLRHRNCLIRTFSTRDITQTVAHHCLTFKWNSFCCYSHVCVNTSYNCQFHNSFSPFLVFLFIHIFFSSVCETRF